VFVDGLALPGGSTSWCKPLDSKWHNNGSSIDGTVDFLTTLSEKQKNVVVVTRKSPWKSKDDMVNAAIKEICKKTQEAYLFQIDADEQWTTAQLEEAIKLLDYADADCGMFCAEYWLGDDLRAVGEWGECKLQPYRRLWRWKGQKFATHEPPELEGGNGFSVWLPERFNHYAYYYDNDVKFKSEYY
jgi:hypothetical protein